jgi:hypothetical protein
MAEKRKKYEKTTLIGNIGIFEEEISGKETSIGSDIIPESVIVYTDLVFTLKNSPGKYIRPVVRFEDKVFKVIENNIFYRASREAGIKKIKFDIVLDNNPPLDELFFKYRLEYSHSPVKNEYLERFLFFKNEPGYFRNKNPSVIPNPSNFFHEFKKENCLAYKILLESPKKTKSIENELVAKLFNENGYLRSIDGIRDKSWRLGRYIS